MISRAAFRLALCVAALAALGLPAVAHAQNIVRQPGNHPDYAVEIEPHLAFQWADRVGVTDGFAPGVRFNIPFLKNGPVSTINNNMAITFGLDLTFGDGGYGWCYDRYDPTRRIPNGACNVTELWLPVGVQWNFYLTKVISVFGEGGFAIAHRRWSYDWLCNGPATPACEQHNTTNDLELILAGGGRFMFSDKIGATIRIGFPMITAGINFLL